MNYSIPEDLSIPEFLRRAIGASAAKTAMAPPKAAGTGFNLLGKPYSNGFTMRPNAPQLPVPFSGGGVPATTGGLPVPTTGGLPVPTTGGGLPAPAELPNNALDIVRQIATKGASGIFGDGVGSLLGRVGGPIGALLGMTTPAGNAADNGTGELLRQPTFPNGVPLPAPRPPVENLGNPYAGAMGGSMPLPTPRPAGLPLSLAAPAAAPAPSFYNGPGSSSFGAGDQAPGAAGLPQTDLLSLLMNKLRGTQSISGGAIY